MTLPNTIETIDPSESKIFVRRSAATISDSALVELREVGRTVGKTSDCLRKWLGDCVAHEIARRNSEAGDLEEAAVWHLPWHAWNDDELRSALVASYCWYDVSENADTITVLREVHRAIVTACCTRLGELHQAILRGRERNATSQL